MLKSIWIASKLCSVIVIWTALTFSTLCANDLDTRGTTKQTSLSIEDLSELRKNLPERADSVIVQIKQDYKNITNTGDRSLKNQADYLLGLSYYFKGMYLVSNYYYDQVIKRISSETDFELLEAVYNNKGINLELLGYYESTIETYFESLNLATLRKDTLGIGQTTLNLGVLFHQLRETDRAIEFTDEALDLFQIVDDSYHIALGEMNYGAFIQEKDPEKSSELLYSALARFYEEEDAYRSAETYYHLANLNHSIKNYETAVDYAKKSLKLMPVDWFINLRVNIYSLMIDSYYELGAPDLSFSLMQEIKQAIEMKEIHSVQALEYFWPAANKVLNLPSYSEKKDLYQTLRVSFDANMEQARFENIMAQFDILSTLEQGYADSLELQIASTDGANNGAFSFLYFWAAALGGVGFILYMFRNIFPLKARDKKPDQKIQKIMSYNSDQDDRITEPSSGVSGMDDKETDQSDSISQLFPQIKALLTEEKLIKNPELSRELLANKLHTNKKYISLAIKRETGLSFNDYVNKVAISMATKEIVKLRRHYTNKELAEICGYSSEATFYRNFKKITGMTPSQLKEKAKKEQPSEMTD